MSKYQSLPIFILVLFLVACTEAEKKTPETEKKPDPNPVLTNFLPYIINTFSQGVSTAGAYSFVDANNPLNPLQLINHEDGVATIMPPRFYTGTVNRPEGEDKVIINNHVIDAFLYEKNNAIYKVDVNNVYSPETKRLSTESEADKICRGWNYWADDYVNPGNSSYIYYLANSPENCSNFGGQWRLLQLSMSDQDAPIALGQNLNYVVAYIHNYETGELNGWLVVELVNNINTLVRYDTTFQNREVINFNVQDDIYSYAFTTNGKLILRQSNNFYLYDDNITNRMNLSSPISIDVVGDFVLGPTFSSNDYFYFIVHKLLTDDVVDSSTVNRLSLSNSFDGVENLTTVNGNIEKFSVNGTDLLFSNNNQIKHLDLTTRQLETFVPSAGYVLGKDEKSNFVFYAIDGYLFIELMSASSETERVVRIVNKSQQLDELLFDHYLVGSISENILDYAANKKIASLIFETGGLNSGNRKVHVLKPENYPSMTLLGTLPNNDCSDDGECNERMLKRYFSTGHQQGLLEGYVNSLKSVFYFNANEENSLKHIVNKNVNVSVIRY